MYVCILILQAKATKPWYDFPWFLKTLEAFKLVGYWLIQSLMVCKSFPADC